ncbi:MAG TPA: RluA family pseudouridine synthase [Candidatus Limnocylindrales bacterium]|nr:RluA family pseudouridine synthase [Candidatus Limnocylindrales bacterium]
MSSSEPVAPNIKSQRLDHYVLASYPELSRSYAARLIDEAKVLVNGTVSKPGYKLRVSDVVTIEYNPTEEHRIPDIDLPILYQDDDVIVINKPVGIISHARGRYWDEPSVASFVRQITGQPGERAGIVHRLDRATSGVMICAKNQATLSLLQRQFSDRKVKKTYTAIVSGHIKPPQAIIDMPIERNPKAPSTFRVGNNGKPAQTKYTVVLSNGAYDKLILEPATGRTHQLRVHLSYRGHPIVGDSLYQGVQAERLYLHAYELTISIPKAGVMTFTAPLPEEFNELVAD